MYFSTRKKLCIKHKPIFKGGYQAPEYQSQALINWNVFYCKNCLEKQSHQIIKEFYSFPDSLIIYFNNEKEIVYNKEEIHSWRHK